MYRVVCIVLCVLVCACVCGVDVYFDIAPWELLGFQIRSRTVVVPQQLLHGGPESRSRFLEPRACPGV
eukprot:725535-Pyramimonas_sp.AAC.1